MNISAININQIFSPKSISKRMSTPAFKSGIESDVFVKNTEATGKVDRKEQVRAALPEYLYHLTNKENYEKMMDSGEMRISKDVIDGIFMFDMDDFQNNWRTEKNVTGSRSLAVGLVEQALKSAKGLVLLRIPTKNLDPMKFAIRPEDDVLKFIASDRYRNLHMVYAEKGGIFNNKWELPKDLVNGYSPIEAKKYTDEGRAIEYVYQDKIDIPTSGIEKVFEVPDLTYKTTWGFGIKDFNDIFDNFVTT